MGDFQNSFPGRHSTILFCRSCSRFRDINPFGDSYGACCFLSTHFCALALSTGRVSKSRLVSQLQRRKKIDRPYRDNISKVTVDCWYLLFSCHSEMTPYLYKSYYYLNVPEKKQIDNKFYCFYRIFFFQTWLIDSWLMTHDSLTHLTH